MSSAENPEEKPTIIVDSDWKEQVEAEKEALRRQQAEKPQPPQDIATEPPADEPSRPSTASAAEAELPPASFSMLVMSLSTQALSMLGLAPGPEGEPMEPHLPMAKHLIDTLGLLEEKTKGNLSEEESHLLGEALTQLRLSYVSAKKGK